MTGIGERGKELGTNLQRVEEPKTPRCLHAIAHELEKALATDLRLLAKQVVAKKLGKAFRGHGGDKRAPASLERVQVGRDLDPGEEVVLQEVGRVSSRPRALSVSNTV